MFRAKRWYIEERDQTGKALFGPFPETELNERYLDEYGQLFRNSATVTLRTVRLTDRQVRGLTINPPHIWYASAAKIRQMNDLVNEEDLPEAPSQPPL